jgi:ribosomal protein S18 acetylase RimI-like enzyme
MVQRMTAVRPADTGEVRALSRALAQAVLTDAVFAWMIPQRLRRLKRRELMFRLELETYVLPQGGLVHTVDNPGGNGLAGACLTLPPDQWRMPTAVDGRTALRWLRVFGRRLSRATSVQKAMNEHHPDEPHYYIRTIGVRPGMQGRGLGSALMRPTLDLCDSEQLPAYLEASSERSAALYVRLGFAHLGVLELPGGAPPVWPMRRPPSARQS